VEILPAYRCMAAAIPAAQPPTLLRPLVHNSSINTSTTTAESATRAEFVYVHIDIYPGSVERTGMPMTTTEPLQQQQRRQRRRQQQQQQQQQQRRRRRRPASSNQVAGRIIMHVLGPQLRKDAAERGGRSSDNINSAAAIATSFAAAAAAAASNHRHQQSASSAAADGPCADEYGGRGAVSLARLESERGSTGAGAAVVAVELFRDDTGDAKPDLQCPVHMLQAPPRRAPGAGQGGSLTWRQVHAKVEGKRQELAQVWEQTRPNGLGRSLKATSTLDAAEADDDDDDDDCRLGVHHGATVEGPPIRRPVSSAGGQVIRSRKLAQLERVQRQLRPTKVWRTQADN
jgi:hypothetical protein